MADRAKGKGRGAGTRERAEGSAPDGHARDARAVAVERLLRVEGGGAHVARLTGGLAPDDAPLASDLVAGVTRLRRRLDFLLAPLVRGGLDRLAPPLHQLLRVGLYDLLERGTPPHAAVGRAVDAAHALSHRGGAGLVNAVLRAAARAYADGALPRPDTGDEAEDLAVWHSYPTWLVRRWLPRYGPAGTGALLTAGNVRPHFGLRANRLKTTPEALAAELAALDVAAQKSRWIDDVLVVERLQPVLAAGLVGDGRCAVQDEAAALVVRALDPWPGLSLLDAAAAPGGKTLYVAELISNNGHIVALDPHARKLELLRRAAEAHGVTIVGTVAADLRQAADSPGFREAFDAVLLDAPCSGLGVLARRADLRWNRAEADLAGLTALQDALLDAAARTVRPGGLLVYSTCSIEPDENEARVEAFLARHPAFALEDVGARVPAEMRTPDGFYQALPHVHGTDGAFAARLRRSS